MTEVKRYASVKKSSLAGLSEEWDESCYAYVVPATYEDHYPLTDGTVSELSPKEQVEWQKNVVKSHFVSGKIKVFNGEAFELADMQKEDVAVSVAVLDKLYADIMGFDLDPKDLRKAVRESALLTIDENNTETTSSEESPTESASA